MPSIFDFADGLLMVLVRLIGQVRPELKAKLYSLREVLWGARTGREMASLSPALRTIICEWGNLGDREDMASARRRVALGHALLGRLKRARKPALWAFVQCLLGTTHAALFRLTGRPEEAIQAEAAFLSAQQVFTRVRLPSARAGIEQGLGALYTEWHWRTGEERFAKQAETAYKHALRNRMLDSVDRAKLYHNLGALYLNQYRATAEWRHAAQAEAALQRALFEVTPASWMGIQPDFGLLTRYRREVSAPSLWTGFQSGIVGYSLDQYNRASAPSVWAMIQHGLGLLYLVQYRQTGDRDYAEQAEMAYQNVLLEHTRERTPDDWAMAQHDLGTLYLEQYRRTRERCYAEQAEAACQNALLEWTYERAPTDWAMMYHNLGGLYVEQYRQTGDSDYAERAETAFRNALLEYTREHKPVLWATTHSNLGELYLEQYLRTEEARYAAQAEAVYSQALKLDARMAPAYAMSAQRGLARLLMRQERWEAAEEAFTQAIKTAERQYLAATDDAERRQLMAEHATLYREHAYCLLRLGGDAARALARLDQGRARGLGEVLGLEGAVRAMHGDAGVDRLRALSKTVRGEETALRRAEEDLATARMLATATTPVDLYERSMAREQAAGKVRAAYAARQEAGLELGAEPELLTVARLQAIDLPEDTAIVALMLLPLEQGSHALVLHRRTVEAVPLPQFNVNEVEHLLGEQPPEVKGWIDAYDSWQSAGRSLAVASRRAVAVRAAHGDPAAAEAVVACKEQAGVGAGGFILVNVHDFEQLESARRSLATMRAVQGAVTSAEAALAEAELAWRAALEAIAATGGKRRVGWYFAYRLAFELTHGKSHPAAEAAAQNAWRATVERIVGELGDRLWAPLTEGLPLGVERVLLVTGGVSALLPLHAAAPPGLAVGYAPSLGVWLRCQAAAAGRAPDSLLLATPAPPEDLTFTAAEAEWLAALFATSSGAPPRRLDQEEATVVGVLAAAPGHGIFHFSGHAYYDWDDPLRSGLLCHDGVLTLARARQELDLSTARLVGLSACSTGVSDVFWSGEEWVGLPAALLEAGAPAVVASLWPVNDLSTAFLMDRFYALWREPGVGRSIAGALREAGEWLRGATWRELGERVARSELPPTVQEQLEALLPKMQTEAPTRMVAGTAQDFVHRMSYAEPNERPFAPAYYWASFAAYGAVF